MTESTEQKPRTINDDIEAYKTMSPEDKKLISLLVNKLMHLQCPHCGKQISTTIEL